MTSQRNQSINNNIQAGIQASQAAAANANAANTVNGSQQAGANITESYDNQQAAADAYAAAKAQADIRQAEIDKKWQSYKKAEERVKQGSYDGDGIKTYDFIENKDITSNPIEGIADESNESISDNSNSFNDISGDSQDPDTSWNDLVVNAICQYLYLPLSTIKLALDGAILLAKAYKERIENLIQGIIFTVTSTADSVINFCVAIIKNLEKSLMEMLPGTGGSSDSAWCHSMFKCLVLLKELMDPSREITKKLLRWVNNKYFQGECKTPNLATNAIDFIRESLEDFISFQQLVCKFGLTLDFFSGIVKSLLEEQKAKLMSLIDQINEYIDIVNQFFDKYLRKIDDLGITELCLKLLDFLTCVFTGGNTTSCAELASVQNYFDSVESILGLHFNNGTVSIDQAYKTKVGVGVLESMRNKCMNTAFNIDRCLQANNNPLNAKNASKAYDLAKIMNVSYSNIKDVAAGIKNGTLFDTSAMSRGANKIWNNIPIVAKYNTSKEAWHAATKEAGMLPMTIEETLANAWYDPDDDKWYITDGCGKKELHLPLLPESERIETVALIPAGNTGLVYDETKGEINTIAVAAYKVWKNPNSDLAKQCQSSNNLYNGLARNPNGVLYAKHIAI